MTSDDGSALDPGIGKLLTGRNGNFSEWITNTGFKPVYQDENVFDAALRRIRFAMAELPGKYIVSFSGGKDSTSVMMMSLIVARELGKLPLEVAFIDEEMIDPDTIAYATDILSWDEINLTWFCVPIRHTLRSKYRTHWYTWDPLEKDVWARDMPEWAVQDVGPLDEESSYGDVVYRYYMEMLKIPNVTIAAGIRIEEAFNRARALLIAGDYIVEKQPNYIYTKPIYDWKVEDIWRAVYLYNWPHSQFYDRMWLKGVDMHQQRVAPWGNVASARETRFYPEFYPDFWERAIARLPELKSAQRYGYTTLFRENMAKPAHLTWQEYTGVILQSLDPESQEFWISEIDAWMRRWRLHSEVPFPDDMDGQNMCWRRLATMMIKNDRIKGSSRDRL